MQPTKPKNLFYSVLILFMVALPFSEALISVAGVLLFLVALAELRNSSFKEKIIKGKNLLLFTSIYFVYLIGMLFCRDLNWGLYDLQKNIPFLIIPLAFIFANPITKEQLKRLMFVFAISVILASLITMISFYLKDQSSVLDAQQFGFIHHIRFSFQVILAMIILSIALLSAQFKLGRITIIGTILALFFLFVFLIWHQSLTGIITLFVTTFIAIFFFIGRIKRPIGKLIAISIIGLLILIPSFYIYSAVDRYYTIDEIVPETLKKETKLGNEYKHDLNDTRIENGHYVGLYLCEKEIKEAWNEKSDLKYDDIDKNGYKVKYTLIRYLTSLNLTKDAEGVRQLTEKDVENVKSGISNYILADKGLSLYPRIYVSVWELDTYFKTGQANQKSLAQRIEYLKAAQTIIKDNFWFGVGTGNWRKAYVDAYIANESQMDEARYGVAHNQYINYWVKFGLIGLLWILFAVIYPVIKSKSYRNPIFFLFLISMLIANLGDSNLEDHVGSSYFVLMYCLFVASEKWEIKFDKSLTE